MAIKGSNLEYRSDSGRWPSIALRVATRGRWKICKAGHLNVVSTQTDARSCASVKIVLKFKSGKAFATVTKQSVPKASGGRRD